MRALASNWRLSGILTARSGTRLNVISGVDRAFNGISAQRPDIVPGVDIYGPGKDTSDLEPAEQINNYLNRDAFALPAPGTVGNATRNLAVGPSYWQVDLAISKLISIVGTQRLELRLETFNLFNTFNWGDPAVNLNAANFGRITTQAGASAHPAIRREVRLLGRNDRTHERRLAERLDRRPTPLSEQAGNQGFPVCFRVGTWRQTMTTWPRPAPTSGLALQAISDIRAFRNGVDPQGSRRSASPSYANQASGCTAADAP